MKYETARAAALALPETTEEPHHHFGSFRVRGKIFVTVPPDRQYLHVFVDEEDRELALAAHPEFVDKLLWGGKVVGIRVALAQANAAAVKTLVRRAYDYQSAKPTKRAKGNDERAFHARPHARCRLRVPWLAPSRTRL